MKLTEEYKRQFYDYNDIDPEFKEQNGLTLKDTGIDGCDKEDTIVQCKLRKKILTWKEVSTFFGSQNMYSDKLEKTIIRWNKLIISRNDDCRLSSVLKEKVKQFIDREFNKKEMIDFCKALCKNPPQNLIEPALCIVCITE